MARVGKAVVSGVFIAAVGLCLSLTAAGRSLEEDIGLRWFFAMRGPVPAPPDVIVVSIDRASSDQLGIDTDHWPPPRHFHANVVRSLSKYGASAIVLDIFFKVPRSAEEDADLADAIASSGRVTLFESVGRQVLSGAEIVQTRAPIEPLRNAAVAIGAFPLPDRQLVHFFWTFFDTTEGQTPTLPAVALQIDGLPLLDRLATLLDRAGVNAAARLPRRVTSTGDTRAVMRFLRRELAGNRQAAARAEEMLQDASDQSLSARDRQLLNALLRLYSGSDKRYLNYYGPPGQIRTLPVNELLRNDQKTALDLNGKVVFVGEGVPGLVRNPDQGDTFHTVYSAEDGVDLSGSEIAATAFANLLTDRALRRPSPVAEVAILLGIGVLIGLALRLGRGAFAVALVMCGSAVYGMLGQYQFNASARVLPIAIPLLVQVPLGLVAGLLWRYLSIRRQVPREIDQGVPAQLVHGVCLSTDVEGYTAVSQHTEPGELASLMNEYFSMLARLVKSHDGLMVGRAGDSAMCVWAPSRGWRLTRKGSGATSGSKQQRARARACQAALELRDAIEDFNRRHSPRQLATRIGLDDGELALGPVGGEFHVIGDTPNVASRIQALNKQLKTTVLASESVVAGLDDLCVRPLGAFVLKGRSGEVKVVEIVGRAESVDRATLDLCERFAHALEEVVTNRWFEAARQFHELSLAFPGDGPTRYYEAVCAERVTETSRSGRSPSVIVAAALVAVGGVLSLGVSPAAAACREPTARIVSIDRSVQVKEASTDDYVPASLNAPICQGDHVRVGPLSRATIAFVGSGLRLTIEQNTEWTVRPPRDANRSFIDIIKGAILFFSRQPRSLDVHTPFVNAATEGTEFLVRVEDDNTMVAVLEGTVSMTNDVGALTLSAGQSGRAVKGQAPRRVDIRPRDAVRWALYYEPLLPGDSLDALEQVPASERDARFHLRRASVLLDAGRVEEASRDIEAARGLEPRNGEADAFAAIIGVAQNDNDEALKAAQRAVELSPQSTTARLALSYALQAKFDLEAARDALLPAIPADSAKDDRAHALVLSRLAELWLSLGYPDKAVAMARRAAAVAPEVGRAHSVLGFAALARSDNAAAKAAFEDAIARESNDPLAHLGYGLTKIRDGDLEAGRQELETAAALSPEDSIVRSYLGKAYFEEKRDTLAARQFALAEQLDPRDPTAFFYDAIRKHAINRPIDALRDLQHSIDLNDNRAVYRSRFLLDDDLAARSARVGQIYRDLGFEQLALDEGWRSLNHDPLNHSAHRLLADSYFDVPRQEIARDSELLQAQLLQPINLNPVQPRLADNGLAYITDSGISAVGFNEFTRLFVGNQAQIFADVFGGNRETGSGNVIVSGVYNRFSYSVGNFYYTTDGARENQDLRQNIFDAYFQAELSSSTSVMAELRTKDQREGDRPLLFASDNFSTQLRTDDDTTSIRLGVRQRFAPGSVLIGTYSHEKFDSLVSDSIGFDFPFSLGNKGSTDFTELRYLQQSRYVNYTAGVGYLHSGFDTTFIFAGEGEPTPGKTEHTNGYFYLTGNPAASVSITAGLSADASRSPALSLDRSQANPKFGVTWNVTPNTLVRAAAFRTLKRFLVSSQTIEPTNVAGFNQFFDDANGTSSWRYGVGIDQKVWPGLFAGGDFSYRDNSSPLITGGGEAVEFNDWQDDIGRAYLYATIGSNVALRASYEREHVHDDAGNNPDFVITSTTHRVPLEGRFFAANGAFGRLRATHLAQDGSFLDRQLARFDGEDSFWMVDAALGFRLPRQLGILMLDMRNLFDKEFRFQDTDPRNPRVIPGRQILARATVAF